MTHASPTVFLLWSILCGVELAFLVSHLWKYDRFQCLRWGSGRQPGAFKRVMTYSYLLCVPLLFVYSLSSACLKYDEGYVSIPGHGIVPKPVQSWSPEHQRWVLPIMIVFSVAWSLEIVSHLEELTFWLFLLNQGVAQQSWFRSFEFRIWVAGSVLAIGGLPVVTIVTRDDPLLMESWTVFVGSTGSLLITIWFLLVLFKFPKFLRTVRTEGAETEVMVRLTMFNEFNRIRIVCRFLFVIPFFILSLDGISPSHGHHEINESALWTDFLVLLGSIGCITSSILTLLIFFPRSIAKEYWQGSYLSSQIKQQQSVSLHRIPTSPQEDFRAHPPVSTVAHDDEISPHPLFPLPDDATNSFKRKPTTGQWEMDLREGSHQKDNGKYMQMQTPPVMVRAPTPDRELHPMILSFTSPIDFLDGYSSGRESSGGHDRGNAV